MCSTAGEISGQLVTDNGVSITALQFKETRMHAECVNINAFGSSFEAGRTLAARCSLNGKPPKYLLVLSDGGLVNGTELLNGIHAAESFRTAGRFQIRPRSY